MASKVKTTVQFKTKELFEREGINEKFLQQVGKTTVKMAKDFIKKGISPVRGVGRYEGYAKQRKGRGYPDDVRKRFPSKKVRPVNLFLDGTYLEHFSWFIQNKILNVGMTSSTGNKGTVPKKINEMFDTHNEGKHSDVPQRKHLPNKRGEQWNVSIQSGIKSIFEKGIFDIIKRGNGLGN